MYHQRQVKWTRQLRKKTIRQARSTPVGRGLFRAATIAAHPRDYVQRRRAALRYNRQFPSDRMSADDAFVLLPPGALPGTPLVLETCRRIFADKLAAMEAAAAEDDRVRKGRRKGSFLRNLLTDEDRAASPELVDFALSDSLLSMVTNYLGVVPRLNSVDLIYSLPRPEHDEHIASQLYHQDPEGLTQAKVFLNVFDVDEADGPFMFVPARESERVVRSIRRARRRAGARDEARYRDEELEAHGGLAAALRLLGPAGAAAVVDTSRCLHAGSRLMPGRFRLLFFVQYCTSRENAHRFDARRFRDDPVRSLVLRHPTARSA